MKPFSLHHELDQLLHCLGLKTFRKNHQAFAEMHEKEKKSHLEYLYHLCVQENEAKEIVRKERLLKSARMPRNKVLNDFNVKRIPNLSRTLVDRLATGKFMDTATNLLVFGKPGAGKSHLTVALAREWCLMGRRVLCISASQLLENLKKAEQMNGLHAYFKKLDRMECLIIDDISVLAFNPKDSGLLFQLISERYERRSIVITSNVSFGKWESFFPDKLTAISAIDRLVHHAEILELNPVISFGLAEARKKDRLMFKAVNGIEKKLIGGK